MDLVSALEKGLPELNARLQAWDDKYAAEFQKLFDWNAIPPGKSSLGWMEECGKLARERAGPGPSDEVAAFLDALCRAYLEAMAKEQASVRDAIGRADAILRSLQGHIAHCAERLRTSGQEEWLRLALAAAAIEDNRIDYRDMYVTLGELVVVAAEAGLDAWPYFQEVAATASGRRRAGSGSMRKFLEGFHSSAHYKECVRRQVRKANPNRK